jgi:hypothetical protein
MAGEMNFAPRPSIEWSDNLTSIIDTAMQAENASRPRREYLGASRVGDDCLRKLGYEYFAAPKDQGREFKGSTLRIFDMGHDGEARQASYLRLAGFQLITEKADGGQIGFAVAWDDEKQSHRFSGHIDGVITSAPYAAGLSVPALWEAKSLGEKSWNDTVKKGVRASKPVYFAQMQLYMAYLDLAANPGLFTALNRNTGQIYAERVAFDAAAAQAASDKGVRVVTSRSPEELPRCASKSTDFRCKFCDYANRCWSPADPFPALTAEAAKWSFGNG